MSQRGRKQNRDSGSKRRHMLRNNKLSEVKIIRVRFVKINRGIETKSEEISS